MESQQAALLSDGKLASASLDERLEKLYRENVKLCEEVQHIIEGKSNDMNLLDSLNILAGLREASEKANGTTTSGKLARPTKKGAKSAADDVVEEVASPRIRIGLGKDKGSRAGSVAATREASVKLEDGAESVASSNDGVVGSASKASAFGSALGSRSNRLVLTKGEIVFCRHSSASRPAAGADAVEGEGILCKVTAVIGEGKQRRYEVQDADTSGSALPPPQRASVSQLIKIPEGNDGLGELPKGKSVLAMYPDTTTFYKADVSEAWKEGKHSENVYVKLIFQEDEAPREVERRFVFVDK